jgi:hypothetical protein
MCMWLRNLRGGCQGPIWAVEPLDGWFRRLVAGLSPRRLGFASESVHMGFVVEKVALGQGFLQFFCFSLSLSLRHVCPCSYTVRTGSVVCYVRAVIVMPLAWESQCWASVSVWFISHSSPWWWRQWVSLKRRSTRLHGEISQKAVIFIHNLLCRLYCFYHFCSRHEI